MKNFSTSLNNKPNSELTEDQIEFKRLANVYYSMISRCSSSTNHAYKSYGGRGISVCDRWLTPKLGLMYFLEDMGDRPEGHQIERRDNNGNYDPKNCYWASRTQQSNNRRSSKFYEYKGQSKTLTEWARGLGTSRSTLETRLRNGWSLERSLTTPLVKSTSDDRQMSPLS